MRDITEFLSLVWHGKITFKRLDYFYVSYDRFKYGGWNYYAFYCGLFKVVVSQ